MATLAEIRTLVRRRAGNDQSTSDAVIDGYIQSGQRELLDTYQDTAKSESESEHAITVGDYSVDVTTCRAIIRVMLYDATDDRRVYLQKLSYDEMIDTYPELENTDQGEPVCYTIWPSSTATSTKTIRIMPPSDNDYTIIVLAKRYAAVLVDDADENYWSVVHPNVLVSAAVYQWALDHSNNQLASLMFQATENALRNIAYDIAEEEAAEDCAMER